ASPASPAPAASPWSASAPSRPRTPAASASSGTSPWPSSTNSSSPGSPASAPPEHLTPGIHRARKRTSMDIEEMRARLRADLRDPEAERWDDHALGRHIQHAVSDLSLAAPLEVVATIEAAGGTRNLDVSALADRVTLDAVEFPP